MKASSASQFFSFFLCAVFSCIHTTCCEAYSFMTDRYGTFNMRTKLGACCTHEVGWGGGGQEQKNLHKSWLGGIEELSLILPCMGIEHRVYGFALWCSNHRATSPIRTYLTLLCNLLCAIRACQGSYLWTFLPLYDFIALIMTRVTRTFLHKQSRPTMISRNLHTKSHEPVKCRKPSISRDERCQLCLLCLVNAPLQCLPMCCLIEPAMAVFLFLV